MVDRSAFFRDGREDSPVILAGRVTVEIAVEFLSS